jgi:hypothetical protein
VALSIVSSYLPIWSAAIIALMVSMTSSAQTTLHDPELSGLSDKDKDFITRLCRGLNQDPQALNDPDLKNLSDYQTCLSVQLSNLKTAPPEPDLSGLSDMDREIIERYCENGAQSLVHGITGFRKCLRSELGNLKSAPFNVDLSSLSNADRQRLSPTCWDAGFYGGITNFLKCASKCLVEWKKVSSQP